MPRVLVYGDSNTYGTAPMERLKADLVLPAGRRWADVMAQELGQGWDIVIEGLPGRTTLFDDPVEGAWLNGLTVLPAVVNSHRPIDVLVLCLGTNDFKARFGQQAQDVAMGVARLVSEAAASGVVGQTLVICPPPVRERGDFAKMFAGAEARAEGLAAQMERFATAAGAAFFDAGAVIAVDEADGIHWSEASHSRLAPAVAQKLRELVA